MSVKYSKLDCVAVLWMGCFSVFLLMFYISRPDYNHDLSGYLGVVLSYEELDPVIIHANVFDQLEASVPTHRFERLVGSAPDSAPVVRALGQDPEAFRQSLAFYEVRVVYTGAIYLLSKVGIDPIFASHAISAVSVFLSLWIFAFLFKDLPPFPYLFFLPVIALGVGLHQIARLSSPDALGLLGWSLAAFLFLRRRNATLIIFPILVLTRTDYVLFVVIIILYLFISKIFDRRLLVVSAVVSLGAYFGVNHYYGGYGLVTALNYSYHYGEVAYPETAVVDFNLADYFELLLSAVASAHSPENRVFYIFIIFAALSLILISRALECSASEDDRLLRDLRFIVVGGSAYIAGHVLLLPRFDDRYFSFIYLFAPSLVAYLILSRVYEFPCRREGRRSD